MDINTVIQMVFDKLPAELWVIAFAVWAICFALKKASFFPDRYIPLAAVVLGVILNVAAATMFTRPIIIDAIVNGVICGIAAVYIANIIKQIKTGREETDDGTDGV